MRVETNEDVARVAYAFSTRTARGTKTGAYFTLSSNIGPDRYFGKRLWKQGYIKNTCYSGMTRSLILDIDAHDVPAEAATACYNDVTDFLSENGLHYISGISSREADGSVRGYHIYVLFNNVVSEFEAKAWGKMIKGLFGYDALDIFPCGNPIRLYFIAKHNGSCGENLHWDYDLNAGPQVDILNDLLVAVGCANINSNSGGERGVVSNSTTHINWSETIDQFPRDMGMDDLHAAVKSKAVEMCLARYPFTSVMVERYYGCAKRAAEQRAYRWRKTRADLIPDVAGRGPGWAHMYSTGIIRTDKTPMNLDEYKPVSGHRNVVTGHMVREMRNRGYTAGEVLDAAVDLYRRYYHGDTPLGRHISETKAWLNSYKPM